MAIIEKSRYSEEAIIQTLKCNGIPLRFLSANLDDFQEIKIWELDSMLISKYIYGKTGVGKTRLLCAIGRQLSTYKGPNPDWRLISIPKLLLQIRQCFGYDKLSDQSEMKLVELYSNIDILLLDDLGAEKVTEWSLQTLYIILNERYENEKTTIITSNYSLEKLKEFVGERIVSRIAEMCLLTNLAGKDRRI